MKGKGRLCDLFGRGCVYVCLSCKPCEITMRKLAHIKLHIRKPCLHATYCVIFKHCAGSLKLNDLALEVKSSNIKLL